MIPFKLKRSKSTQYLSHALLIFTLLLSFACRRDSNVSGGGGSVGAVDINDPNALTGVLIVPGSNLINGNMPSTSNSGNDPNLVMFDSTVSYSAGSQIKLPINYNDNSGSGIQGIRFQVNGADKYFDVPATGGSSGQMLLPIGVPSSLGSGQFCITLTLYDAAQNVSNTFESCITVTQAMGCGIERVSGGEGRTSTLHNMGSNPGIVQIDYETYTVPDRIDVFYNGDWVAGTGSNPGPIGSVPPLADCNNPTEGYIGENGTFCFSYDPVSLRRKMMKKYKGTDKEYLLNNLKSNEHLVEVVVSGCVRGGTAWKYQISCADPGSQCARGQEGSPRFNLKFDGDVDFDLHVEDPSGEEIYYGNETSASGGELDVDCVCCPEGDENIFWISGTAPTGSYKYWVNFFSRCGQDSTSNYTLTVSRNGNVVSTETGSISVPKRTSPKYTYLHN